MTDAGSNQTHFWQVSRDNQTYTELCNALYERELLRLSQLNREQLLRMPERLASLPFYIRRAASNIVQTRSELELDSQNASWYHKQAASCPARKQQADPIAAFYGKQAKPGLVVPVYVSQLSQEQIVLDSIDEVDSNNQRLHCNEHGWFSFSGTPLANANSDKFVLKPSKAIMTAACCGHQWLNDSKTTPRRLNLRELLLASRLNWQNFAKPLPALLA
ncbi:MAG: hypothetical protein KKE30_08585 [Gammaproteobacteria bacterium]|nr:hypothetical protein [Gammaproteobacteria bacterium]MBU1555741.1 hypothetical protein [Gammaproteobacteria bacterium]MBU2071932.1 hypothetical protein [Gammaproteobacteria bacterium]MBU2181793.1 hypothetical protein [Gammaproteobacteria bacterium]MBU2206381.1 hypothetical protein [Gammaproteobacteria bacterium]